MAIDRVSALRNAEKLIRQGKLDQAIAEYARVVEDQPDDWTSANSLGDLYVRTGQSDKAVEQFTRIADSFLAKGFAPKAQALYKKILKIKPDSEHALTQAAAIAASQGLLVDARSNLNQLAAIRRRRGDMSGVAEIELRLAALDPNVRDAAGEPDAEMPAAAELKAEEPSAAQDITAGDPSAPPLVVEDTPSMPSLAQAPDGVREEAVVPAEPVVPPLTDFGGGRPIAQAHHRSSGIEVDLSVVLDQIKKPIETVEGPVDLDDVFAELRDQARRRQLAGEAEQEFRRGIALFRSGQIEECIPALEAAARAPRFRFDTAAILGRIYLRRGLLHKAIEWLERAAEAPPRTPADGHAVLYDLADTLESIGDSARALAVYLQIHADAGAFRDVPERVTRLSGLRARR